jgi:hypothetical protein
MRQPIRSRHLLTCACAVLFVVTFALSGCAGNGSGIVEETLGGGGGGGAFPPTLAAIQEHVFGRICINCHIPGGPGPMPLTSEQVSYDSLVNAPSVEVGLVRVAPGDPANSYILYKLRGAPGIVGDRMPPPPEKMLTPAEIQSIEDWIAMGAPR